MMAGRRALRKIQLGRETTAGTNVAATSIWRGVGTIKDDRQQQRVSQDVGIIGGTDEVNQTMLGGTLSVSQTPATFEQFLHVLEASVKTATPAQDGTGDGYIYTYALPTTSAPTIKYYSIEAGDDAQAEEMSYCFVKDWTLQGSGRTAWQLSANWQGREVTTTTFTGALTLPAVSYMNFGLSKIYIDVIGGTYGTTIKSSTLRGANIKYASGIEAKDTADGRLDFSFAQTGQDYTMSGQLEFEHDTIALANKVDWRAMTARKLQIKIEGPTAFTNAGTTYTVPTVLFNLPLRWSNFEKIGEANGNDIVTGSFISAYNVTAAAAGSVIVVAALTAVP
jgi:hypothetical protein